MFVREKQAGDEFVLQNQQIAIINPSPPPPNDLIFVREMGLSGEAHP